MSKATRNRRRLARLQAPVQRLLRDAPAGYSMDPDSDIALSDMHQLVGLELSSSGVHSRSLGWIPTVMMTLTTVPVIPETTVIQPPSETMKVALIGRSLIEAMIRDLELCLARAEADAVVGLRLDPLPD